MLRIHPVTGPPGAGKTTAVISLDREHTWLARFGVRDHGLELADREHPLGLAMRDTLLHGQLVSDRLVRELFEHFLDELPAGVEVVAVEGYPRDMRQCADLAEVIALRGHALGELLALDIPDEVVTGRVARRRICVACGAPDSLVSMASCDSCGGPLIRRHDDAAERVTQRLRDYRTVSAEVRSWFGGRGLLHVIDATAGPAEVRTALGAMLLPSDMDTMMVARRTAIDAMAGMPAVGSFDDIRLDIGDDPRGHETVQRLADVLVRDGAALLTGLSRHFDLDAARLYHEELFGKVWQLVRHRCGATGPDGRYRVKVNTTSDGAIPLELYGSQWSFKQLHMDRDALLFSHLYGPVHGFGGGSLLLADAHAYLYRHRLQFADVFTWSEEATPGSKPVVRAEHENALLAECGVDVGGLDADTIIFVNNFPEAGVVHGVTPVVVEDRATFVREYHRCSVKEVSS